MPQALRHGAGNGDIGIGHDDDEFLATEPRHRIKAAQIATDPIGQFLKHGIACRMAIGIVDTLEEVDIEHDQR